ncbi:putative regulator of septum formation [Propionicimonas paludicola]|uniref:Putative regulator of septum formation n=1 Tax=Propionicimonas paludicola TaxID=185243 RepID=A0A2A9CPE6_9ACTN|nr:septum formation family protein [Propionicimonas paludicola]PFG16071.1 putative regulator of septum formation [Propionicimonas paludicola]
MRAWVAVAAAAVLLAGCAAPVRDPSGRLTAPTTADAYAIRAGDCVGELGTGSVTKLELLPCDQEHYWEAFLLTELEGTDYPGDVALAKQSEQRCTDAFAEFVGTPLKKSKYSFTYLSPTEQTWKSAKDRALVCLVGLPNGGVTGSLRGVAK